jgi:hypothetical protein
MNANDVRVFEKAITGLSENFSANLSEPGINMWFEALRGYSIEQVKSACLGIMKSRKYTKMPTAAEFIEFIDGNVSTSSETQAYIVIDAMGAHGAYKSIIFDDPVTMAVIESRGGWVQMCSGYREPERKWWVHEFMRTYAAYKLECVGRNEYFMGLIEHENSTTAKGLGENQPEIIMIGDKSKCRMMIETTTTECLPDGISGMIEMVEGIGQYEMYEMDID